MAKAIHEVEREKHKFAFGFTVDCRARTDFGWGKHAKVEITSMDRDLTIGLAKSKDGSDEVEVGLVLNKHEMDLFSDLFREGLCDD
ncbi:Phenolic glucoside malonyltransferase 1 [Spatholobus suberectus]|nr:Phenolic glucoside malonyltransferase 1 [Spatholobus suberectus]